MDPEATTIQKIQDNGNQPEEWLQFLIHHQKKAGLELTSETCQHLVFLYERAVNQISAEKHKTNFSYARLLVECAKLQMRISEDDARRTFQLARSNAKHFAIVFVAWAQFELSLGNKSKCRGLLRKGKDVGAQPVELLIKAYDNLVEGKNLIIDESHEQTLAGFSRLKKKSSDSSGDFSPLSQGDDTSTGDRFTDSSGISSVADNTSAVISFKLPSVLEGCEKQPVSCRRSTSSSSDETDSFPLQHHQRCSMSTQKLSVKSTPDFRSANSLVSSMNLSVRCTKTRRRPRQTGIAFGLPVRVKMPLSSVNEPGDDLDGITELECTVDVPPETLSSTQGNHTTVSSTPIAPCGSEAKQGTEQISCTGITQNAAFKRKQSDPSETKESGLSVITSRQQHADTSPPSQQNINQPPVTQEVQRIVSSNSTVLGSGTAPLHKQNSNSVGSFISNSGNFLRPHDPQVSHSGRLQAIPGQNGAVGFAPGYPPDMQIMNAIGPTPTQAPQDNIVVKGKSYLRLGTIGKGGSSKVYRAFDGKRICAMKYVNLEEADDSIIQSYINEINLLNRLQGNENVIKLFDWELSDERRAIILVMECGSIDLAGFLRKNRNKMTKEELKGFWRQMLEAVHVVHQQGIIHRDLKPANFLLVEARLKLIDFGIAHTLQTDKTSIELDTQVGTLNFMSPEAFQDISQPALQFDSCGNAKPRLKIGRPSDVWSLGCILYMMVYGRTPFQHIANHVMKLQCIMDPSHEIEFPSIKDIYLLDVMKGCLRRNPKERFTIPHLLDHPFINSSSHDPLVEIEDNVVDCVMEIVNFKADVNSPRSIRNFCKQRLAAKKMPHRQAPDHAGRRPLVGVDVQALNRAQQALKPPHVSGNDKYMMRNANEQNKENADINDVLKRELAEKYRNAIPPDISESTFEQSWNTTTGR